MKSNSKFIVYLTTVFLSLISLGSQAAVFNIIPKTGNTLPTQVPLGGSVAAYYTITNTTQSFHAGNYVKYLPPNVNQVTQDNTVPDLCGTSFNLVAGGSCTLELSVTGPVNANDPNPRNHLFACLGGCVTCCAGTKYPLNVAQGGTPPIPPVLSSTSPINAAVDVAPTSTIQITFNEAMNTATLIPANIQLYDVTTSSFLTLVNPSYSNANQTVTFGTSTALNSGDQYQIIIPVASRLLAANGASLSTGGVISSFTVATYFATVCHPVWIVNQGNNSIASCTYYTDGTNNGVVGCTGNGVPISGTSLDSPTALWYDGVYGLSITNLLGNNTVVEINLLGGFPPTPSYTGTLAVSIPNVAPTGIVAHNSMGWIANSNGTLIACGSAPNNDTTNWGNCDISTPPGYSPKATTLSMGYNATAAAVYTANISSNTISVCLLNSSNVITGCVDSGGTGFNLPTSIYIAPFSNYALITNSGNNTLSRCDVNPATFALSNCVLTGSNVSQPSSVFEDTSGSNFVAYITNTGNDSLTMCNDDNGLLSNCQSYAYGFNKPVAAWSGNTCS